MVLLLSGLPAEAFCVRWTGHLQSDSRRPSAHLGRTRQAR